MFRYTRVFVAMMVVLLVMASSVAVAESNDPTMPPAETTDDVPAHEREPGEPAEPVTPGATIDPQAPESVEQDAPVVLVKGITVSLGSSSLCLFPGQSLQAKARIKPADATSQRLTWSSSAPHIVSVSRDGLVTVNRDAQIDEDGVYVDIWAKSTDGSFVMNCATVCVMPTLTDLSLLSDTLTVFTGAETRSTVLPVEIAPAFLCGMVPVVWSSSRPDIVSVSAGGAHGEVGLLSWGRHPGTARIRISASFGRTLSDTMTVNVVETAASVEIEAPDRVALGSSTRLSARCLTPDGKGMPLAKVAFSLGSPAPGVQLTGDGLLRIDRYCSAEAVVVRCTVQDPGMATAYKTLLIRLGEDAQP